MNKLRRIPEALSEGWYAFRTTLSAKPQNPTTYHYSYPPPEVRHQRGDIWIKHPEMDLHAWTGRKWKPLLDKRK